MNIDRLKRLGADLDSLEQLKYYMSEHINQKIIKAVHEGEDVTIYPIAKKLLDSLINQLHIDYKDTK